MNEAGTAEGLYVEILELIASKKGWELEFIPGTKEQNLKRLDNGSIDILPVIPYTPKMETRFALTTEAVFTDWGTVYTYKGSEIKSMGDLTGKKIAYQDDIFYQSFNASPGTSKSSYTFLDTDSYTEVLELVETKKADAGIVPRSYGDRYGSDYNVEKIPFVIAPTDMVFALSREDIILAETIDENIRQITVENGEIAYVSQEIKKNDLTTWETPSWLKLSAGIGIGLLLLFVILSLALRDKVEEKTYELNSKNRELEVEIRERKVAEEKLKQYSLELKNSNELKDLFTDILRHDLINPATVIKGYVEFLIDSEEEERKKQALKAIERNNKKLIYLIENAAHLAKLENMDELNFETRNLKDIIDETLDNLKPKMDEKDINIIFDPENEYPADVNSTIEDVFSNIIGNSIKYSPERTKITINIEDIGYEWEISITDEGEGIPDKDKPYIFDRFKRAHKVNIKGSGLGLAIVKRIVDLHEGTVKVEDGKDGKGTTFKVILQKSRLE